jgi:hypothetical protein
VLADVPEPGGAEEGICNGVRDGIGVGVAGESKLCESYPWPMRIRLSSGSVKGREINHRTGRQEASRPAHPAVPSLHPPITGSRHGKSRP